MTTRSEISDDAKCVAACLWGINPGLTLRYGFQECQPTARVMAALCELIDAGMVSVERKVFGEGESRYYDITFSCKLDHAEMKEYRKYTNLAKGIAMFESNE